MTTVDRSTDVVSAMVEPIQLNLLGQTSKKFDEEKGTDGIIDANATPTDTNKVGQSVFYDCLDLSPTAEKQDFMKPERSDTEEESK